MSPTARTLKRLREQGYTADVVERSIPHTKIKKDLFGIIDILAIRENEVLGVQATDGSNVSKRVKKLLEAEHTRAWLLSGSRLEVWGWRKLAKTGRWEPRIINFCMKNNILVARTQKT